MKRERTGYITKVYEEFKQGDTLYRICDYKNDAGIMERHLSYKPIDNSFFYLHSSIYIDQNIITQPIYIIPQELVKMYFSGKDINRFLVLGCAGCTFPRFLLQFSPLSVGVGIENSETMIHIALKYFMEGCFWNRFSLVHADAFLFMSKLAKQQEYDLIFVDLFTGTEIPEQINSDNFVSNLFSCSTDNSLIIVNLLGSSDQFINEFVTKARLLFGTVHTFDKKEHKYTILLHGNAEKESAFFGV